MPLFKSEPKITEKKVIEENQKIETAFNESEDMPYGVSGRALSELNCFEFGNICAETVSQLEFSVCRNTKQIWPHKYSPMKGTLETLKIEDKNFKSHEEFQTFLNKSQKNTVKMFFFVNRISNYSIYWQEKEGIKLRMAIISKK